MSERWQKTLRQLQADRVEGGPRPTSRPAVPTLTVRKGYRWRWLLIAFLVALAVTVWPMLHPLVWPILAWAVVLVCTGFLAGVLGALFAGAK